jgi:hypothetical protein
MRVASCPRVAAGLASERERERDRRQREVFDFAAVFVSLFSEFDQLGPVLPPMGAGGSGTPAAAVARASLIHTKILEMGPRIQKWDSKTRNPGNFGEMRP